MSVTLALPRSPALDAWLGADLGALGPLSAKADLAVDGARLRLKNLAADAQGLGTVIVDAQGGLGAFGGSGFVPTWRPDLSIKASIRDGTKFLSAFDIPAGNVGPLNARLKLATTPEGYRLDDIALTVGQGTGPTLRAEGSMLGTWQAAGPNLQTVAMTIKAGAPSTTALLADLGMAVPEFGPLRLEATLGNNGNTLSIKDIVVELGNPDRQKK